MRCIEIIYFAWLVAYATASDCSIPAIYIDVHNRWVTGTEFEEYGAFIGIGSPSQNQSLWPALAHNESTFASAEFCTERSPTTCQGNTHSNFVPELSSTWQDAPQYQSLDNSITLDNTTSQSGTDTLGLYTHYFDPSPATLTSVSSFPANILSNYSSPTSPFFGPAGLLGLGPDSTVLDHLYNSKRISSRSYGLYLGTAYPRAGGAVNGSLTLGGYDAGRFEAPVHSYKMTDKSLKVQISQMSLTSTEGGNSTTYLVDSPFDAEITSSQYPLTLPLSVTQYIAATLKATAANNEDNSLRTADAFIGNLTITLSDGLTISFPPEWVSNASNITPISADPLTAGGNDNGPFLLGTAFLSYIYITANYDSSPPTFHLARALPDAAYVYATTLCPDSAPTSYTTPAVSPFASSGFAGAIVGGVIGGIAAALLGFVLLQKWLRKLAMEKRVRIAQQSKDKQWAMDDMEPVTPGWPASAGAGQNGSDYVFAGFEEMKKGPSPLRVVTDFHRS